jgi:hypothetical protein
MKVSRLGRGHAPAALEERGHARLPDLELIKLEIFNAGSLCSQHRRGGLTLGVKERRLHDRRRHTMTHGLDRDFELKFRA